MSLICVHTEMSNQHNFCDWKTGPGSPVPGWAGQAAPAGEPERNGPAKPSWAGVGLGGRWAGPVRTGGEARPGLAKRGPVSGRRAEGWAGPYRRWRRLAGPNRAARVVQGLRISLPVSVALISAAFSKCCANQCHIPRETDSRASLVLFSDSSWPRCIWSWCVSALSSQTQYYLLHPPSSLRAPRTILCGSSVSSVCF